MEWQAQAHIKQIGSHTEKQISENLSPKLKFLLELKLTRYGNRIVILGHNKSQMQNSVCICHNLLN